MPEYRFTFRHKDLANLQPGQYEVTTTPLTPGADVDEALAHAANFFPEALDPDYEMTVEVVD